MKVYQKLLVAAALVVALVAIVYVLDRLPDWMDDYSQHRTDVVMNRIAEKFCNGDKEVFAFVPIMGGDDVGMHVSKKSNGWTYINVWSKSGKYPEVRFYNIKSPMCCWGYEIIWDSGASTGKYDPDKVDKYVRQARRDAEININILIADFPGACPDKE